MSPGIGHQRLIRLCIAFAMLLGIAIGSLSSDSALAADCLDDGAVTLSSIEPAHAMPANNYVNVGMSAGMDPGTGMDATSADDAPERHAHGDLCCQAACMVAIFAIPTLTTADPVGSDVALHVATTPSLSLRTRLDRPPNA